MRFAPVFAYSPRGLRLRDGDGVWVIISYRIRSDRLWAIFGAIVGPRHAIVGASGNKNLAITRNLSLKT